MANQPLKWQETNGTSRRFTMLKTLAIVALFIVLQTNSHVVSGEEANRVQPKFEGTRRPVNSSFVGSLHDEKASMIKKAIEDKQPVMPNKMNNNLNHLLANSPVNGRPGEYFYYRLNNASKFFEIGMKMGIVDDGPVFTYRGIQ